MLRNEEEKIIEIYDKYRGLMFHVALGILKDHAQAEDAVGDSFEKLILNIGKIGDISCYQTRALIVTIVRNTAINIWNKAKRTDYTDEEMLIPDNTPPIPDIITSAEGYNSIVETIKALPETYRDVAVLSLINEFSHEEIAKTLDISYNAVKMRLSRAKQILRKQVSR
ncbi:MAG: sigma-70 family RNA polymerase sigma factor [Turicibacter sp.]|nr:sigma-70 family RNA polymerase sigma factor [Turicibacter sp.]